MRGLCFICNTPSAAMASSVLHRPVESATLNGRSVSPKQPFKCAFQRQRARLNQPDPTIAEPPHGAARTEPRADSVLFGPSCLASLGRTCGRTISSKGRCCFVCFAVARDSGSRSAFAHRGYRALPNRKSGRCACRCSASRKLPVSLPSPLPPRDSVLRRALASRNNPRQNALRLSARRL